MSPITNARVTFAKVPTGYPIPGETTVYDDTPTIDLENVPLNGGILVKTLCLSSDPYMRGRMREAHVKSYSPPFTLGDPITHFGVGVVLLSESSKFKAQDHVYGFFTFEEYIVRTDVDSFLLLKNEEKLPWSAYVGAAGMPGETAYMAWKEFSSAKKGEIAFVTAASGPVGSAVVQLAKLAGLKVIASAGSTEKCDFVKSLGADVVFNYKTTKTLEVLQKEGPIDVFWDNVGGESLEAVLATAATHGRLIECGQISGYNGEEYPVKGLTNIFAKQLHIYGFIVASLRDKYTEEFYKEVPARIASGEIKYLEDRTMGLKNAGDAILAVQKGINHGKSVIIVAED